MKAFLTGSRRYRTPTEESDIDMVVRTDDALLVKLLCQYATARGSGPPDAQSVSVKFGTLNLLLCLTDAAYATWADGTEELMPRRPVTRDEAIQTFTRLRKERGLE